MRILSVDLAATFSAWVVRDGREVLAEGDSGGQSAFGLARTLRSVADDHAIDLLMVETLAPMMTHQIDRPLRLQGIVALACHPYIANDTFRLIQPQTWQKEFPGVGRAPAEIPKAQKDRWRAERAAEHALNLGYEAPNLVGQYIAELKLREGENAKVLKKHTNPLDKQRTDYVDAWLINEWCQRRTREQIDATQGVTPFLI